MKLFNVSAECFESVCVFSTYLGVTVSKIGGGIQFSPYLQSNIDSAKVTLVRVAPRGIQTPSPMPLTKVLHVQSNCMEHNKAYTVH